MKHIFLYSTWFAICWEIDLTAETSEQERISCSLWLKSEFLVYFLIMGPYPSAGPGSSQGMPENTEEVHFWPSPSFLWLEHFSKKEYECFVMIRDSFYAFL